MRLGSILLLCCLLDISEVLAQQPVYKHYTVANGLPSSEVYYVMQDHRGFMWFATDHGVCRFDGTNFTTYTTAEGLADNTVFQIIEDSKGRLWFLSYSGKLSWFQDDRIFSVKNNEFLQSFFAKADFINSLYVSDNDEIWMGLLESILQFKLLDDHSCKLVNRFSQYHMIDLPDKNNRKNIEAVLGSRFPELGNKIRWRAGQETVELPIEKWTEPGMPHVYCISLSDGTWLWGNYNRIIRFNKKAVLTSSFISNRIINLYRASDNSIWISKYKGGITRLSPDELITGKEGQTYFPGLSVTSCFIDGNGSAWFSTLENGVYFQPSQAFYYYPEFDRFTDKKVLFVGGRKLKPASDENEEVYAGLLNGVILRQKKGKFEIFYDPRQPGDLFHTARYCFTTPDGDIWMALSSGLLIIRPDNTIIKIPDIGVTVLTNDNNGRVLGSEYTSLYRFRQYKTIDTLQNMSINIRAMCNWNGSIYLGSLNGLWRLQGRDIIYLGKKEPLLSRRINSLEVDKNGRLWIASLGGGVMIKEKDTIYSIGVREGLLSNLCNSLYIDRENTVWVCSNKGLSRISLHENDPGRFSISNYTINSGLVSNEVNRVYRQDNKIWVATNGGMSMINLDMLPRSILPLPIYITAINNNSRDTTLLSNYQFAYNKNNIGISYAGISYNNAEDIQYKYLLKHKGDISEINTTEEYQYTTKNTLQLTSLAPGNYTFNIWAKNASGPWSITPAGFSFTINPPFWATWWFKGLVLLLIGSMIFWIIRWRFLQLLVQSNLKNELNLVKQDALSARMNPHFMFNALTSIQNYISMNKAEDAHNYLSKFARLMRLILENSKSSFVSLESELNALKLYIDLEMTRLNGQVIYRIDIDPLLLERNYKIPAMLIQPYVENAIKHGLVSKKGEGKLLIDLKLINDELVCLITDNGIGRKKANMLNKARQKQLKHESMGTILTESRIKLLGSIYGKHIQADIIDLYNAQKKACGTQVKLVFPLQV